MFSFVNNRNSSNVGYSKTTESISYKKVEGDEVEDLYELLNEILVEIKTKKNPFFFNCP
jgi:hypothetical protein